MSAILTAAGESARMGRPKALLLWHGVPLVQYQVRSLIEGGASEVVVVLGHQAETIAPYVGGPRTVTVVNARYGLGRATSIRMGVRRADPHSDTILLLAVDQPRTAELVSAVIHAHAENDPPITSPRYQARGGHPVVFSSRLRGELERVSEKGQGIREVFQNHRDEVLEVDFGDPMVRLDLNTPEQYEEARLRYGA